MQQWSLVRVLTQLTFVASALVVVAVEGKALREAHYRNAPGCLVECLGEWGVFEYPRVYSGFSWLFGFKLELIDGG